MHSHYSIIIICYARSALKQLLNFHSQRHRFRRRRRCRLPSVKRDGCFAVTNETSTATTWRKTLISFEFTFDITTNRFFHRILLLIFKVHDGPQWSHTRVAHGRQLSVVQISMKNIASCHMGLGICLHSPYKSSRPNRTRSISLHRTVIKNICVSTSRVQVLEPNKYLSIKLLLNECGK